MAGTKITASFPPFLYQLLFFLAFSWSCSSLFRSLGRCNGLSPSWSPFFLVSYALRAELTTLYLNFSLYPEYCILKTISLTFSTTLSHGNCLLQLSRTLRTSWFSTVLLVLQLKARILEEKNTRSHWPKRKRGQPYGSTVKRNTTVKCRN